MASPSVEDWGEADRKKFAFEKAFKDLETAFTSRSLKAKSNYLMHPIIIIGLVSGFRQDHH